VVLSTVLARQKAFLTMTQDEFVNIQNYAAIIASEDNSNDFYTILESLINEKEQGNNDG
jgi:hypothetical protein